MIFSGHTVPSHHDPVLGDGPVDFWDTIAPDGDRIPWFSAPVGSRYAKLDTDQTAKHVRTFVKRKDDGRDDDWVANGVQCITATVARAAFTDGGGASGTYALNEQIPQGAWVLRTTLVNVTGFTGDTSAAITVGDGTDVDRYNTGAPSVFTTSNAIDLGAPSGTQIHTSAATITITITSAADFTAVTAGQLTLRLYYLN
jgi:hypothetical protein